VELILLLLLLLAVVVEVLGNQQLLEVMLLVLVVLAVAQGGVGLLEKMVQEIHLQLLRHKVIMEETEVLLNLEVAVVVLEQ
jgi:hypothetical protein